MSRLLTEDKLFQEMQLSKGVVDTYDPNILQVCKDIAEAEHKETLKAVQEWLENNISFVRVSGNEKIIWQGIHQAELDILLEALKRGVLPKIL